MLTAILMMPSPKRATGEHPAQACLVRAGPGTGKTWMCKQAVYMLGDRLREGGKFKGVKLVPVVMYVQQIVYLLRDASGAKHEVGTLMDKYVDGVHKPVASMLKQAFKLRALIVILDGVDEAAGLRQLVETFVYLPVLGPKPHDPCDPCPPPPLPPRLLVCLPVQGLKTPRMAPAPSSAAPSSTSAVHSPAPRSSPAMGSLDVLVPSGNRVLITSRVEGNPDRDPDRDRDPDPDPDPDPNPNLCLQATAGKAV